MNLARLVLLMARISSLYLDVKVLVTPALVCSTTGRPMAAEHTCATATTIALSLWGSSSMTTAVPSMIASTSFFQSKRTATSSHSIISSKT
jgi:hypothetical protein